MKTMLLFTKLILRSYFLWIFMGGLLLTGCEDYLEPNDPVDQISNHEVFGDEATATAAVTSMYAKLRDEVLLTGKPNGLSLLMGIYSDELDYYPLTGNPAGTFYTHQVLASNELIAAMWNNAYNLIYMSNAIVEGLAASKTLEDDAKRRLKGEALFVRSLVHFYLVNLFGDVPYVKTTDYRMNSIVERIPAEKVYQYILDDLEKARELLESENIKRERIRPSKWAVTALRARLYLYTKQWQKAESESSMLIDQSPFNLEEKIMNVFLKESTGTIWQLDSKYEGDNSLEGITFYIGVAPPQLVALSPDFVRAMEIGDLRRQHWVEEVADNTSTWYFPYKYKEHQNTGTSLEYSIVFRLAEQYLIRAEARARQGNIQGAQQDLNVVRQRAGLQNITTSTTEGLLKAILEERRFELFTEYGHRWFDLRRTGKADEILSSIKSGWKATNLLFPIPEEELLMNPNLKPQNPGY